MSLIHPWPTLALTATGAVALLLAGAARPALAHPHVWVTAVTTFEFDGPWLVGLRHHWRFDEFFSSFVVEEHDADGDGRFDPAELASVMDGAFSSLADYGYFTHLRVDGEPLPLTEVADFQASIADGVLTYEFALALPQPVDPATVSVAAGVYDPEYYVEVLLDREDPVRFRGMDSGACIFEIGEDAEHPIYFGMVDPLTISLICATS